MWSKIAIMALVQILLLSGAQSENLDFCLHSKTCTAKRGAIYYETEDLDETNKDNNWGRAYTIEPEIDGFTTTFAVVFHNITLDGFVYFRASGPAGMGPWQSRKPKDGKLEYFAEDATTLKIYVPSFLQGHFMAHYYTGCSFSIQSSGDVSFPNSIEDFHATKSCCWIMKPILQPNRRRIYFSLRKANFVNGGKLTVHDLHSSTLISSADEPVEYDLFGADTDGQDTVLVDLDCGEEGICFGNHFTLSYYAVSDEQVVCIEVQKECNLNGNSMPEFMCRQTCPALDEIVNKEYENEALTSVSRAGDITAKQEQEEEIPQESLRSTGKITNKCTHPKYCRCALQKKYCYSKRKCRGFHPHCFHTCVFMKIVICPRIIKTTTIKLL